MADRKIDMVVNEDGDVAYLSLPDHPGKGSPGVVAKQISLHSIIKEYKGPEIYLDFDKNGVLIGMEFLLEQAD
ncbi:MULTISPECIES: DUF2283 domain-containing protein [Paraburkholderia]|uniref:DUF2283 domain-containing protein n=1 Tax=Paraburkholderia aromaticivorans TaxID=2026199 RepID=A0A248VR84_9BURK|nr:MULTISPECIES: DUF2283 domain-containing protein [Paraburkholderia]ASW01032.1 DUF2283 domain-containing protein [Paraburkholderia aromaticivorans]TDY25563.1 uncharacterized protein DUF2283 [Paraburkholderia sp. BL6665CI2N2]